MTSSDGMLDSQLSASGAPDMTTWIATSVEEINNPEVSIVTRLWDLKDDRYNDQALQLARETRGRGEGCSHDLAHVCTYVEASVLIDNLGSFDAALPLLRLAIATCIDAGDSSVVLDICDGNTRAYVLYEYHYIYARTLYYAGHYPAALEYVKSVVTPDTSCTYPHQYGLVMLGIVVSYLCLPHTTQEWLRGECYQNYDTWPSCVREALGSSDEAFASLIAQILDTEHGVKTISSLPSQPRELGTTKDIHLLGDSHILPLAWQTIRGDDSDDGDDGDGSMRLIPHLTMGGKAFHFGQLLPGSIGGDGSGDSGSIVNGKANRRPKCQREPSIITHQFARVPRASRWVFVFGEIDLRPFEGIPTAVDKGYYPSLEEGVRATAQVYIAALCLLCRQNAARIAIHPVRPPPPCDSEDRRDLIALFNQSLHTLVNKLESPAYEPGRLHVLSIVPGLVRPDNFLTPELILPDLTHLQPLYASRGLLREVRSLFRD